MTCLEAQPLLNAFLDGELDLNASVNIDRHLETCQECSGEYRKLEMVRAEIAGADLDLSSDAALRRMRASVLRRPTDWRVAWRIPALAAASATAILAVALFLPGRGSFTEHEIVDSHLRSLLGDHLLDVPSTDRHTVKPWFQGKLEFAPPVPDLTAEGFVLAGGRLDVIDGRKAAALVYKRREHVINLWIAQGGIAPAEPELSEENGYHLIRWSKGGMTYRAVSDLDLGELRTFARIVRAQ